MGNGDSNTMLCILVSSQFNIIVWEYLKGVIRPIKDKAQNVLTVALLLTSINVF